MFDKLRKVKIIFCITVSFLLVTSIYLAKKTFYKNDMTLPCVSNIADKKTVYLTFDDGPIPVVTTQLLDVLKEYNVKATFFIVGKEIDGREEILNRIYKEGHGIGLHTYTHNFKKIYLSEDNFINEMLRTQNKIKEITGYTSNIIRFPGGSSGHLNQNMLENLHKNNLKVYDWNVNLEDGIKPNLSINKLVNNAKKYNENYSRIILLMHCNSNNKNTVKALPLIIDYYKNLGYEFKPILEDTNEYYYRFKK
ncbi:polysaccharide deacetylase family protein [Clostridium ganghwense]|uniref:Polysaccharide deacetylase n=1 Tax=Clostridium ganghwense TaxID=312089 RepID=A0ABT4CLI1_9CLOT|nr:polysaccharide deacetylase family protein [Clostridium ganghwense]MCY6369907.1 polysaccharide deacetylase [Clostridium ganghwense]